MVKKQILFLGLLLFGVISMAGAQTRISGKVTDAGNNQPIPLAGVIVKGTSLSVTTNINGEYTIDVPEGSKVLIFSYEKYIDKEEQIGNRTVINVTLKEDVNILDEVIVVAYGTATRSSFTGSASSIKSEDIAKRQVSNVTNAIAGQVAGVQAITTSGQPGSGASIRIRGIGSMSASNAPLYIIDGSPYSGTLSSINNMDIESMTVLKDAAASAIYGARGANGVVIITTKKGTTSVAKITIDSKWGSNSRGISQYETMRDPGMYYETFYKGLYNSRIALGNSTSAAHSYAQSSLLSTSGGLGYSVYDVPKGEQLIGTNGKLNPNAKLGYNDGDYYYTPDSWHDEMFLGGNLRQEYNVSVSGTTDKFNYYLSAGYLDDEGIIPGSGFERYTIRLNSEYQAKKWLRVGGNVSYTNYDIKAPSVGSVLSSGNIFALTTNIAPIYPMYVRNPNGQIKVDSRGITVYDFGTSTNQVRSFMPLANPGITLLLDESTAVSDVFNGRFFAIVDIWEGLKANVNFSTSINNQRSSQIGNPYYGTYVGDEGRVDVSHARIFSLNKQILLTYSKDFGKHGINLMAGYEAFNTDSKYLSAYKTMLYQANVGELNNAIIDKIATSSSTEYSTLGYFGQAQYDYGGKYFFSASYRRDASSRFHKDNRWGNFGSVGGAWLINKEEFFESLNASWINLLKIKTSYGIQGNDALTNDYPYLDQFTVRNDGNNGFAVSMSYKGNKDITWETSYNFNAGIDFSLFGSRIDGTIEFFSRKTIDLLYNQPVPLSWGYSSIPTNVGSIRNQGIEFDISALVLDSKNLKWRFNVNATSYKNKILDLAPDVKEHGIKGVLSIYTIGGSLYDSYLRDYAGVDPSNGSALYYMVDDNGKYILDSDNNRTVTNDYSKTKQTIIGNTLPKISGGFGMSFDFYGVDISASLAYQLGGKSYDYSYQQLMHTGDSKGHNWHKDILNSWSQENTNTNIPMLNSNVDNNQKYSSRFLISSNYLSINNITIGYSFPGKWLSKIKVQSLRIYAVGDNLYIFSKRRGLDPRQSLGGTTTIGAFGYSALRTISGGITVTF